jgi:hypothetical protein
MSTPPLLLASRSLPQVIEARLAELRAELLVQPSDQLRAVQQPTTAAHRAEAPAGGEVGTAGLAALVEASLTAQECRFSTSAR